MLGLRTDDSDPLVVMVLSVAFVGSVFALHIIVSHWGMKLIIGQNHFEVQLEKYLRFNRFEVRLKFS